MAARKAAPLSRGDKVIGFIESLRITIGDDAGKNFILRPWQRAFIKDVYDPVHPKGNRIVRRAVLSVARKNGKTELAAALILVHLVGPEAELNGEIYSAANDREQASIVFNAAVRMIEGSKWLSSRLRVVQHSKTIYVSKAGIKGEGSKFRALSSDGSRKHGLNPSFIVYDEAAQIKNRELFDTLTTSQGARAEPLFLTISTQNHDPTHLLSEMIDDALKVDDNGNKIDQSIVCHLHAADDDCDLLDEEQWLKANPALGDFRSLDDFRMMAERAARMPSEEHIFRLLYLNQRVSLTASLISRQDWKACAAVNEDGTPAYDIQALTNDENGITYGEAVYLALDMSKTTDLTALMMITAAPRDTRIRGWYWKPEECLDEHTKRDGVRYDQYARQGLLEVSPGRIISANQVATKIAQLYSKFDVRGLVYDRWHMDRLIPYFDNIGLATYLATSPSDPGHEGTLKLIPWGQGYKDMTPAVQAFEEAIVTRDLKHDGHPLTTFCVMNAMVTGDGTDNRKLDKDKSRFRIDGAVALAMSLGAKARDRKFEIANPWDDPDFKMQVV